MTDETKARFDEYAALLDLPMSETERTAINALVCYGSQNRAADSLGWKRTRLQSRLRAVQARAAAAAAMIPEPPIVRGAVSAAPVQIPPTAPGALVARYILTAAQNNTHVHAAFLENLAAYAAAIGARIMVSRYTYDKASYGARSTKAGRGATTDDRADLWYDPAITPYVCDDPERHGSCRWQLAPGPDGFLWCAEMNILPTAVLPLSGLQSYAGSASVAIPHAKIALESVPVIGDRPTKMLFATGAVTQRNYIAKRTGLIGEFHHQYGALLVEVDLVTGDWWARHLNADADGTFYDLGWRVRDGEVTAGHALEAISYGDIHASEIDPVVADANWQPGGLLDTLRPRYQFWHDTHSHRARSHHEAKSFEKRYSKWVEGGAVELVETELRMAGDLLRRASRTWCQTVVVSSNHDRHGERWLDEADYKDDLPNAEYFLRAQHARVMALARGAGAGWNFLEWAIGQQRDGTLEDPLRRVRFLARDESLIIGPEHHPVECGQHGDEGADGSRGNTAAYARMAIRMNKGHSHVAAIRHGVVSAGVCNRKLAYSHGPSSWSVSHVLTYRNGKRAIVTMRAGKYWL